MCGIAGLIGPEAGRRREAIGPMVAALAHRGPDGTAIEHLRGASLGHRRLSIIDIEGGRQPMRHAAGPWTIVYNGEIYNYRELRRRLEDLGHTFRTRSDTEVILHLYERHGADLVDHLVGMFAFAIWDEARGRLFMARDHLGQKPLFYHVGPRGLAFASEIKALLASGWVEPRLDVEALYHYVSLRFIPDSLTLFDGIRKLPAAHRLVFDLPATDVEGGPAAVERYWSLDFADPMRGSDEEILDRLDHVLRETVREHLVADVEVGSFLSGGIDSSLVTAMMAMESPEPRPTFSIGVREQSFDELPYARRVAERFGTRHHERVVSADLVGSVPWMVRHLEEPADPFGVGVYLASALAAEHVKVVLSGDGGDELFAGYDRFSGQRLAGLYALLPRTLRRSVLRPLADRIPESFRYKSLAQKLRWLNEMADREGGERYAHAMSFLRFTDAAKAQLFTPEVLARVGSSGSIQKVLEHFDSGHAHNPLDRMLYTDLMTRIPDHLLPIVDRMAMAHGLEVRPPLLEHRFVEFAARIPPRLKLRRTRLKHALREVAARHLPAQIVEREKQGFGFPLGQWFRGDLRALVGRLPAESRLVQGGTFRKEYVSDLLEEHLSGRTDHSYRLWILLNLEVWHRLFLEGEGPEESAAWLGGDREPWAAGERSA